MKITESNMLLSSKDSDDRMPVLFLGHGSPMNAIEENEFVAGFRNIGKEIPTPKAILCISAHWETKGTQITAMEKPKTIHDFGGFPKKLYEVQYPAPGNPFLAKETKEKIKNKTIELDYNWGLDHGAWSVIKHLYPNANIPVVQFSIDYLLTPKEHYELGKELSFLRKKGVLIIGSGNIVHNLGMVDWQNLNKVDYAFDWATEASEGFKKNILNNYHEKLINYKNLGKAYQLAVPTPEHFIPLLYVLSQKEEKDPIKIFNDKAVAGSLTMTSIKIG